MGRRTLTDMEQGPSLFNVVVFIGVLLAIAISKMPKQLAIAIAAFVSLGNMGLIQLIGQGDYYYYALICLELLGASLTIDIAQNLDKDSDFTFFYMMAFMFTVAAIAHATYLALPSSLVGDQYAAYTHLWRTIAVVHVCLMLWWSDGRRDFLARIARYSDRVLRRLDPA